MTIQTESVWIEGDRFNQWLRDQGVTSGEIDANGFNYSNWRNNRAVSVWKADHILTTLGFHISQLPDDIWREKRNDS